MHGVQFRDAVWSGQRFVAAGSVPEAGGIFVDSLDGRDWHAQIGFPPSDAPVRLAAGPRGLVAIGTIGDAQASWISAHGLTWTSQPDAFPMDLSKTDVAVVSDVVATETGWLAVGREDPFCRTNCGLEPVRALAWRSADGLHWTAVAMTDALDAAAITAIARNGSGYVAVGTTGTRAATWVSADGTTWIRGPDGPVLDPMPAADPSLWTTMDAVAVGHGVVVAVGSDGPGGAHGPAGRAWWSTDGRTWTAADGEAFGSSGEISVMLTAVATTPDGFVAVGSSNGACRGGIWESTDGRAWGCASGAAPMSELRPHAVSASDEVTVVVGLAAVPDPPLDGLPGAAWSRRLP